MVFSVIHLQDILTKLQDGHKKINQNEVRENSSLIKWKTQPNRLTWSEPDYPSILETELFSPSRSERSIFIILVAMIFVLSLCGNILTFFVNLRRKMRPYFRSCLISLALSDLITTFFLSVTYMSQFTAQYVQMWNFGDTMCSFVPFITTTAILVSSLTLVAIAMDRYFAVRNSSMGMWNPSCAFCLLFMALTWTASVTISSPIFFIYDQIWVYVLSVNTDGDGGGADSGPGQGYGDVDADIDSSSSKTTTRRFHRRTTPRMDITRTTTTWQAEANETPLDYVLVDEPQLVSLCVSDKDKVGMFYFMVFIVIFIPCIVAFLWLNAIIACTIWKRRRPIKGGVSNNTAASGLGDGTATGQQRDGTGGRTIPRNRQNSVRLLQVITHFDADAVVEKSPDIIDQETVVTPSPIPPTEESATGTPPTEIEVPVITTTNIPSNDPCCLNREQTKPKSQRELRHIRMFLVILLMMLVFLLCRLPAWILLMMRMYGVYTEDLHWRLYFAFGVLHLSSCMLNPLFYTFLAETIEYAKLVKVKVFNTACGLRLCCDKTRTARRHMKVAPQPTTNYGADDDCKTRPSALPAEDMDCRGYGRLMNFLVNWNFRGNLMISSNCSPDDRQISKGNEIDMDMCHGGIVKKISLDVTMPDSMDGRKQSCDQNTTNNERDEGVYVGSLSGSCNGSTDGVPTVVIESLGTKKKSLERFNSFECKPPIYIIRADY